MKYTRIRLVLKEVNGETGIRIIDHKHKPVDSDTEGYIQKYYNSVLREYRNYGFEIISHSIKDITEDEYSVNNPWDWYAP